MGKAKRAHVFGNPDAMVGTALRAFAHLTEPPYSAAICLGAGGGLARSAASWA